MHEVVAAKGVFVPMNCLALPSSARVFTRAPKGCQWDRIIFPVFNLHAKKRRHVHLAGALGFGSVLN